MKSILVSADRTYQVDIGVEYQSEIVRVSKDRTRVAILFSESMTKRIPQFVSGDAEYFYFPIPDGEAGNHRLPIERKAEA